MRVGRVALAALALAGLWAAVALAAPPFQEGVGTGDVGSRAFGPIDADRLLDLAYRQSDGSTIYYKLQSPAGIFGEEFAPGLVAGQIGDGIGNHVDVAIADVDSAPGAEIVAGLIGPANQVRVFRPTGSDPAARTVPNLAPATPGDDGTVPRRLTGSGAGDVTNDRRTDAVFSLSDVAGPDRFVVVSAGGVRLSPALPGGATNAGVRLFDLSGDGVLDMVSAGAAGVGYVTANGTAIGGWTPLPVAGSNAVDLAIGRFNEDAVADLVVASSDAFSLLLSQPGGSYAPAPLGAIPDGAPCGAGAGDLNADGLVDLVLRGCRDLNVDGSTNSAITLLGDGRGGFSDPTLVTVAESGRDGASIIDLDGDGYGDVVLIGNGDSNTVVYMNRGLFGPRPCAGCPPPRRLDDARVLGDRTDRRAPRLTILLRPRRWNPLTPLRFSVGCDERCVATVSPTLTFRRRSSSRVLRGIVLERRVLSLTPRTSARVTLRLRGPSKRLVKRLLTRGLVGKLTIRIRAVDDSQNVTPFQKAIGVRR